MKQQRITKYLAMTLAVSAISLHVDDSHGQYYPEAAVFDLYTKEQIEAKRAEDLERKTVEESARLEEKKRSAEAEIAAHRYNIENLKIRQDKAVEELDTVSVDLQAVNEQITSVQAEHKETEDNAKATIEYLANVQGDLRVKQSQLAQENDSLIKLKRDAHASIFAKSVEIERMKGEVARVQTKVEDLRAQAASISAEEMQVRAEWMQNKMSVAENNRQREEAQANLNRTASALRKAQGELNASNLELAKAEKQRKNLQAQSRQQIAEFERQIASANRAKIRAEAEKIRIDGEAQKTLEYAARIKDNRDQVLADKDSVQGLVMQSTLALESARSELTKVAEESSKDTYRQLRREAQTRGLAAASKAYQMVDGARPYKVNGPCKSYRQPASEGSPAESYSNGNKIFARPAGNDWVEVLNGASGKPTFLSATCGSFEN